MGCRIIGWRCFEDSDWGKREEREAMGGGSVIKVLTPGGVWAGDCPPQF